MRFLFIRFELPFYWMCLFLLYFINFHDSFTMTKTTAQLLTSKKNNPNNDSSNDLQIPNLDHLPLINDVSHTFVCGTEDLCTRLKEYYISSSNSFDCHDAFLQVEFLIDDVDSKKKKSLGFLPPNGIKIQKSQKKLGYCKRIKRYAVNDKQVIISVMERVRLVEKKQADKIIESELLIQFEIFVWLLIKLSIYDEENDSILYFKALKVEIMKLERLVPIHGFSHHKCFVCGKRWNPKHRLHEVKLESLINLKKRRSIFVKPDARCCKKHIDFQGYLKLEDENFIVTKKTKIDRTKLLFIEHLSKIEEQKFVFERFKDMSTLSDDFCKKITGWSKDEFIRFSKYINTINDTQGRTKEELIALYRYWLRKGSDQSSLAFMFGKTTTQNQISHYLSQIRKAIYFDFVPYFLGSNKERTFFLKHNNYMTNELFDLGINDLAIVVDATYCRVEKSSNNDFQYRSWSEQKMDLLTKPFIACCPDGYIIECYGPFQANQNDATIFDYILKTDKALKVLVQGGRTIIFMDRGFRDIYQKLLNEYQLEPKMPSCQQKLEKKVENSKKVDKQLSVEQTIETRYVTKCRFIIEKQIGALKNFKSLDNIRNSQAGHIQIDYRIACSMVNFTHKACCADGKNAQKIARRIKNKAKLNSNHLEFLLSKHLDTKLITPIEISEIEDFVRLTPNKLNKKVFLGSYQQKLAKSYVKDVIVSKNAYIVSDKIFNTNKNIELRSQFKNSKVIVVEISSRHRRSQKKKEIENLKNEMDKFRNKYKIFLEYVPNVQSSKSIRGYICSCKSGKKMIGCCVHVASLIFYLACGKYKTIKSPACHLPLLFVNFNDMDLPNRPRCIKHTRTKKKLDDIISSSSSESDQDSEDEVLSKYLLKAKEKSRIKKTTNDEPKEKSKKNNKKNLNRNSKENIEKILNKNLNQNRNNVLFSQQNFNLNAHSDLLSSFRIHIPQWGGSIDYKEFKNIRLVNTCTIDNFLLALWYLSKLKPNYLDSFEFEQVLILKNIVQCIENLNWNTAKEFWVNQILKLDTRLTGNSLSVFGSEKTFMLAPLAIFQKHQLLQVCKTNCIQNKNLIIRDDAEDIYFKKSNEKIALYSCYSSRCWQCNAKTRTEIVFYKKPTFLFIQSSHANVFFNDLPKQIYVGNVNYKLLCATIYTDKHFISIYEINDQKYLIDDLKKSMVLINPNIENISSNSGEYYIFKNRPTTVSLYYEI